tara:strand:+ start:5221 stop:5388 length:168 start_codon:yes stop_codon:yes gene_type:complete
MTDVFQTWFLEEFECNLPLPAVKKLQTENEQEQLFVVPTTQVMQLFPEQEVQEAA